MQLGFSPPQQNNAVNRPESRISCRHPVTANFRWHTRIGTSKEKRGVARTNTSTIEAANSALIVNGDLHQVSDFFASDYVAHVTGKDFTGGHDVVKEIVRTYRRAFSDIEVEIEFLVKAKNRIAWQRTLRAKQTGAFKGFPATNRIIIWRDMITSEFRDGLIAEDWVVTDLAEKLLLARK
jgi:predicted ester cyclase